jgi:transposase-like protein
LGRFNVCNLYRAVDKGGDTVDFLLTAKRDSKYHNNFVEQDHRAVKRITSPMLCFKSFWSAQRLIAGIETMQMVKKGQLHRIASGRFTTSI